jgi:hypothetical protein
MTVSVSACLPVMVSDVPRRGDFPESEPEPRGEHTWDGVKADLRDAYLDASASGPQPGDEPAHASEATAGPTAESYGGDDDAHPGPDPDESPGQLLVTTSAIHPMLIHDAPPGVRRQVASDSAGLTADAAGDQADESGPESAEQRLMKLKEITDQIRATSAALEGVTEHLEDAIQEVIAAKAAGRAPNIDIRQVQALRPGVERTLRQLSAMGEAAGTGIIPGEREAAEIAVRLTAAGETAEQVSGAIPNSSRWWSITGYLKRAALATGHTLAVVAKSPDELEIFAALNLIFIRWGFKIKWSFGKPRASPGGASPGQ